MYDLATVLIALIIFLSFTIQATFGFAGGLIALPLLNFIVDSKDAINLVMIFQFLMSGLIYSVRKEIEWNKILILFPFLFIGLALGLISNYFLSNSFLKLLIGAYLIAYSIVSLLNSNITTQIKSEYFKFVASLFTGYVQGAIGTGGPVIIPYLKKISSTPQTFRANLIVIFSILNACRLALAFSNNQMSSAVIKQASLALPLFIVSLLIGSKLAHNLKNELLERVIMIFLLISGIVLIY